MFVPLVLGGCLPDRAKDMAICKAEASRFYEISRAADPEDPSSRYIIGCMAAKGYDFTISPAACSSDRPLPTQPTCYTSRTWLGWFVDQFRTD